MKRLLVILLLSAAPAAATECPEGLPSCKVLILSPQEEQILTMPNGVLATAAQARSIDYAAFTQYFQQKIKEAPAGEPRKAPPPAPPPPEPDKKP